MDQLNYPPVKTPNQGSSDQPGYALLHPETTDSQIGPEKKLPKPRPNRAAPKGNALASHDKTGKSVKATKTPATLSKKDKLTTKSHTKKKNRSSAPSGRQADAG